MREPLLPRRFERSLAQIVPLVSLDAGSQDLASLHEGLVLQEIEALKRAADPSAIAAGLKRDLGVSVPIEAVVEIVARLLSDGRVTPAAGHEVGLSPAVSARIRQHAAELARRKNMEVQRWLDSLDTEVRARGEQRLRSLDRDGLASDLEVFLLQLVRYHGAELLTFLYPSYEGARDALEVDERDLFAELPDRGDALKALRRSAFPAFVREASGERATLLAELLHRSALLQLLQADHDASAVFASEVTPKLLFLDTNAAFRVLGLQGALLRDAAVEMVELGRALGHRYAITTRTYAELSNLVAREMQWLEQHPVPPPSLAAVAADFVAGNDYVSSFWREHSAKGTTITEFAAAHRHLTLMLENAGVDLFNTDQLRLSSADLLDAVNQLRAFKAGAAELLLEHDAFHKVAVEKLRLEAAGIEPEGWYHASHVFVTFDNSLPRYAAALARRRRGHRVPFCVMGNEWLQVLYFMRPRSTLDANTFVRLLNSPYLEGYFASRSVSRDIVHSVTQTMERVGEYRPSVARRILVDRLLVKRLTESATSEEHNQLAVEAVRDAAGQEDRSIESLLRQRDDEIAALKQRVSETSRQLSTPRAQPAPAVVTPRPEREKLREVREALQTVSRDNKALQGTVAELSARVGQADLRRQRTRLWSLAPGLVLLVYGIRSLFLPSWHKGVGAAFLLAALAPAAHSGDHEHPFRAS